MASIEFWGGLGVIGGSKIVIREGGHRVMLDIGMDIPSGADLFRLPVRQRPGRELADRLKVGAAPAVPGLYDAAFLDEGDPLGEATEPTAVFVSHPHIDHVGLAGYVRSDIPVHAHTDAVDVLEALTASGAGLPGGDPEWHRLSSGQRVAVGPMEVECVLVDHDVPGACGYLVRTSTGTLAFTGDIRFHGRHPGLSWAFADRAKGCDVLVTEGTTLGWNMPAAVRGESDVERDFNAALAETPGLVLLSLYPRDLERVRDFLALAGVAGRTVVWPDATADFLRGLGVPDVVKAGDPQAAGLGERPGSFVVVPDPGDLPSLLDLPVGTGQPDSVFVHANGEPLGPFEPRWAPFTDWLEALGIPLRQIGCSGHAVQDDLHAMVERVAPRVLFPIHTTAPTRLHPPSGTTRVIAEYGVTYGMDGQAQ
ncbi:MBL fold metallo-hydrolase [Streptantibioticus silvisoli]|uniref:MBL fold metallo-hydrolase n=1 Tax=Streptantibioticus silvisoli TaxID=2705255 RepID=A0ABT6WA78_9ACTN|nr:MBL fold metallo-hydrolase [Streptantibioticus silvisoli]MDI5967474.1 MBL fold metallo-hydrolase [Streptantibioticus silvisoli]